MKLLKHVTVGLLVACFLAAPLSVLAADKKVEKKSKPYPLNTCVVSGEKFGGDHGEPFVFVHDGREVKLCCKECKSDFDKETAKFVTKIDAAAKKVKVYALNTCAVTDEKLGGDMGDPYVFIHDLQEIKLCCKDCKGDFDKEPAQFLKKVAKADTTSKK
jgi:YHS domain-containing protein